MSNTLPHVAPTHILPTLGEIMLRDVPVLPGSTDLVQALKVLEQSNHGVAMCVMPGQPPKALTSADCTQLLMTSLQGFPVPQRLAEAAQGVDFQMFSHQGVDEALSELQGNLQHGIAIYEGDQLIGYVGTEQWSALSLRFLQPARQVEWPEDPNDLNDPLTGLPDHRAYRMNLEMRLIDHQELQSNFSLGLIEIDWLDGLVQRHSMNEERSTVQRVSNILVSGLRANDALYCLEAGKWGLIMGDVSPNIARAISSRLIEAVWQAEFKNHGSPLGKISISAGVCGPGIDSDSTENDAEEALEQALMSGGHQVRVLGERLI